MRITLTVLLSACVATMIGCKQHGSPAPKTDNAKANSVKVPRAKAPSPSRAAANAPKSDSSTPSSGAKSPSAPNKGKLQRAAGATTGAARPAPRRAADTARPTPQVTDAPAPGVATKATVGKLAPDFELKALDGAPVKLSQFSGKTVVIEWYNPDCPFVVRAHNKGALIDMAKRSTDRGVIWLAINSGGPGRQGHGLERNKRSLAEYKLSHRVLLDETGDVGKLYGAKTTPQMYIIAKDGTLAYRGALDTSGRGAQRGEAGYKNYTQLALDEVLAGKKVTISETKPWGCSVKYAM